MAQPQLAIRIAANVAELKANLAEGKASIEALGPSVAKMAATWSANSASIIQQAHNITAAIQKVGSANLTAADAAKNLKTLDAAMAQLARTGAPIPALMQQTADALRNTGPPTEGLTTKMVALGSFIGNFASSSVQALGRFIVDGVQRLISSIGELMVAGAGVGDVEENFQKMTADAGLLGGTLLGTLRAGTHATITDFELMKTVNQDLAAGLVLTDKQFGTLAKGAFALAQATGGDVKTALDTMNDAMLTGKTRALALLTGKIDLEAAEKKYASSIHTTADHLTDAGKLEAARMAILDGVAAATGRLGDQTDGLDELVAQAATTWDNFTNNLGKTLAASPAVTGAFLTIRDSLQKAFGGDSQTAVAAVVGLIEGIAHTVTTWGPPIIDFLRQTRDTIGDIGNVVRNAWDLVPDWFKRLAGEATTAKNIIEQLATTIGLSPFNRALIHWLGSREEIDQNTKAIDAQRVALEKLMHTGGGTPGGAPPPTNRPPVVGPSKSELSEAAAALKKLGDAWKEYGSVTGDVYDHLASDTIEAIKWDLERGKSQGTLATIYHVTGEQIAAVADLLKTETAAAKLAAETTNKLAEAEAKHATELRKLANTRGVDLLKLEADNYTARLTSQRDYDEAVAKNTLSADDFERFQLTRLIADQEKKLVEFGESYRATYQLIVDTTKIKLSEVGAVWVSPGMMPPEAKKALKDAAISLDDLTRHFVDLGQIGGGQLDAISRSMGTFIANVSLMSKSTGGLRDELKALQKQWGDLSNAQKTATVTMAALDVATAATDPGSRAGTVASSAKKGAQIGMIAGPYGALVGAGVGAIVGALKVTQNEKDARTAFEAFQKQFGTLNQTIDAVGKAYAAMGYSGVRAEHDLAAALDATHHTAADVAAALATINGVLAEQKQDAADLDAAIQRYGFSIDELGPTMLRQKLTEQAVQLINDFRLLAGSGINVDSVLGKMGGSINEFVATALRTGSEIPSSMKPMLDKMIEMGTLTDASGTAITDLSASGLTFSETMTQGFDRVVQKFDELLAKIGMIPGTLAKIPTSLPNPFGTWDAPDMRHISDLDYGGAQASGGDYLVTRPTLFLAGDAGAERATFRPHGSGGPTSGRDGGTQTIITKTYLDGRQIAEALTKVAA